MHAHGSLIYTEHSSCQMNNKRERSHLFMMAKFHENYIRTLANREFIGYN